MTTIIKRCRGKKKRGVEAIDGYRKKLMIPDCKIPECREFEFKSKIGKLFMNEKIFEEYYVRIDEIDPFFLWALQGRNKSWQKWMWIHII